MRILRRDEFLKLPAGVLFCKGKPWYFESLHVKGDTITNSDGKPIDFGHRDLCFVAMGHDSGELMRRMDEMLEDGASYPVEVNYGRDGCFDDEDLFLVYEAADLHSLQAAITEALEEEPAAQRVHEKLT